MQLLWDVITELAQFAVGAVGALFSRKHATAQLIAPPMRLALPVQSAPAERLPISEPLPLLTEPEDTFKSVAAVIEERTPRAREHTLKAASMTAPSSVKQYTCVRDVPLFKNPTKEFDAILATLPYGATLMVLEERSAWTHVRYDGQFGWVERSNLTGVFAAVRPYFVIKERCNAASEATQRLRGLIQDAFGGERAHVPLQSEEYVYFRLLERGLDLPSIAARPRRAGLWHKLFAGIRGVHIGVRPKTGAVMEYTDADEVGHLAYVEAVFPDESVSLTEIGNPEESFYSERVLTKDAWQALAPVFIQFS
jgi:hypothetical protein